MEEFFDWASQVTTLQDSKLGKAINYALNHKANSMHVLRDEGCALSNNLAERSIRPLTTGRKNFMFSASLKGARANGIVYSIIAATKENGLHSTKYLEYLFEKLPNLSEIIPGTLEAFLPWVPNIQENCK